MVLRLWRCQRQRTSSKVNLAKNSDLPEGGRRPHSPVQEAVEAPDHAVETRKIGQDLVCGTRGHLDMGAGLGGKAVS